MTKPCTQLLTLSRLTGIFLCLVINPAQATLSSVGDIIDLTIGSDQVDFTLSGGGTARIKILAKDVVRVRVNGGGALLARTSPAINQESTDLVPPDATIVDTGSAVWILTDHITIAVIKAGFQMVALYPDNSLMFADMNPAVFWDEQTGRIIVQKYAPPDEHYFGLGMRGGSIDRRGKGFVLRNADVAGYDEFSEALYQSYPFYYGLRNENTYGIFLDNPAYPLFDMDSAENGILQFGAENGELDYYIFAGPKPFDVAHAYASLTGYNALPPRWSLGYHHSRYGWQSEQEIMTIANQLRAQDFPTDALWFDIDYMDQLRKFTWNPGQFPEPTAMHQTLENQGFKRIYIDEPCIRNDDPLWSVIDRSNYFVKDASGQSLVNTIWFGDVSWFDYSNDQAASWYEQRLKNFLSSGIDGLWTDLNEPANNFMPDAVFDFNGDPRGETESRNLYALLVNRSAFKAQKALRPNGRPWNFSRSGYSGIQRYAHTWSGDANSSFDAMRVNLQMTVSMGISGQNLFGHDTGGFLGSPSAELFVRWLEFSGFTPLFRNHSVNTAEPREPWVYGEPYTSTIRSIIKRRYRFLPYIYTLVENASRSGRPVVAPTFFYAEGDVNTYTQDTEYLLGPNLLVAPVFEPGASDRSVYLPLGSHWYDYHTDTLHTAGSTVSVNAPLGKIPLFVREGTILPLGPVRSYDGDGIENNLDVHIWPGPDHSFVLYEDDGLSQNYRQGDVLYTRIGQTAISNGTLISIERIGGSYLPDRSHWVVVIHHRDAKPADVRLNGNRLPEQNGLPLIEDGWYYDSATNQLSAYLPDSSTKLEIAISD